MTEKLKKIISSPLFQSITFGAIITVIFIWVWDSPIKYFKTEIALFEHSPANTVHWISGDFNGNGSSERIRCSKGIDSESLDVIHYDEQGNLTEHYHFQESDWTYYLRPNVFDTDGNGKLELLFFTVRNDSIFFNIFDLANFELTVDHLFFNTIERKRDKYAYSSEFSFFGDFDKNGTNELFFSFDAGFGLYPRGIFKMEFPSMKITASPTEYMTLGIMDLTDFNSDGVPEIFTSCNAPSNANATEYKKYTDTISYIVVLDYKLDFLFEPIPFNGQFSSITCIPPIAEDSMFYAFYQRRSKNKEPFKIMAISRIGKVIYDKSWQNIENPGSIYTHLQTINRVPYLFLSNIGHFRITPSFSLLPDELQSGHKETEQIPICIDLDNDGFDEWLSWDINNEIFIYNEISNDRVKLISPTIIYASPTFYPFYENGKFANYFVDTGAGFFFFNYYENPFYFFLFVIYILVFIVNAGIIYFILFAQKKNIEKKWQVEKQLSELQFNSVKNQLNPHFMFNSLNSVAYLINNGQKDEAYDFLTVNSRMIQRMMNDANEIKRALSDEIQFTKDYLQIQEHRFKKRFKSTFIISPEVDLKFEVPKMCIHTYVENAVKHGFRNTKKDGLLEIKISPLENGVDIWVSDNGMGRKEAEKYKDSTKQGLKIMEKFYRLFEKYHDYKIQTNIIDFNLKKDGQSGIRVELKIQKNDG